MREEGAGAALAHVSRGLSDGGMNYLHVVNGSSMVPALESSGVGGDIVVYADVLHEGPVPPDDDLAAWFETRARFIAGCGWGTAEAALHDFRNAHQRMLAFSEYDDVILWLEHDLFDQLLLIRHLAWWRRTQPQNPPGLVLSDDFLGPMTAEQLRTRFELRTRASEAQLTLASRAWRAFTASDPAELQRLVAREQLAELPHLRGALTRLLEEYPSAHNGLGRTEQQMLEILAQSPLTAFDLFQANAKREEAVFMGDSVFFGRLGQLAAARYPLVQRAESGALHLTDHGREVLAGRENAVQLNGIDRWIGGVRLTVAG